MKTLQPADALFGREVSPLSDRRGDCVFERAAGGSAAFAVSEWILNTPFAA